MDIEKYLSNFFKGTKNPTLKAMEYFMEQFGHPEKELKVIHIAGTNGKGSCTEMITNILINAGYKVGKFISPHLIKYNERISIQNKNISDEEMENLIKRINPKIEDYNNINDSKVTLFELETTMAMLYFKENNCDFVVLETGLGGTYDCTNIVNPLVSIITSIGFDHMHILGNTLLEIAENKAGIIKCNSDTVFVEQREQDINEKINQVCKEKNNKLHLIQKENITNYTYDDNFQKFNYKEYENIEINLKGQKQVLNACICIECIEILRGENYDISNEILRKGLKTVIHKGRFETISNSPVIIYDGAHNKPAIENFINSVKMYYKNKDKVYIVSILKTKDYKSILKELLTDEEAIFIFTDGNNKERYVEKENLYKEAQKYISSDKIIIKELIDALELSKNEYKDYITFIVGSLYIYGDVIRYLKERKNY